MRDFKDVQRKPLDVEDAIRRFNGKTNVYAAFCSMFVREYNAVPSHLESLIAEERWDSVSRLARTLKQSAEHIGAGRVVEIAARLEALSTDRNAEARTLLGPLRNELQTVTAWVNRGMGGSHC
ncbi:Hpt domain-containing protein [Paenibacillus turpanensis]|uniref:Hpt domain-containing protein n=1 Tax=Paenibacillus turpanensis TaxID=2689078 RepID=UPI00140A0D5C|nr:Hpt domain-containing protein [Paenibacillus turpanensis]